jgi:hypothetical protein
MDKVRNDLLSRISRLRVPSKFGTAEISCRKMVEVSCPPLARSCIFLSDTFFSLNILIWGVALCSHAACKNFAGLFACRLILGISEGCMTAGLMVVSSMFYTRREHTARVGYWCEDYYQLPFTLFLTSNRFNGRNWFEAALYRDPRGYS